MSTTTSTCASLAKHEEEKTQKASTDVIHSTKCESHSRELKATATSGSGSGSGWGSVDVSKLKYVSGFGAQIESEALPDALPKGQNNPQKCAYGLYAEQLSGSSFTTPRLNNQRCWLYRIRPHCAHPTFKPAFHAKHSEEFKWTTPLMNTHFLSEFHAKNTIANPNQLRWKPFPIVDNAKNSERIDFIQGICTVMGAGSPELKTGMAIHVYSCNVSMNDKAFINSDGDFLVVPQEGDLLIQTEFGYLHVGPTEIAVIQRGIQFSVHVQSACRGYICEIFNGHFRLPELGPIGANGLANPRDFLSPTAHYENRSCDFLLVQKYMGECFYTIKDRCPYDVVAYHGNYVPFKYDLKLFCPAGAVRFDHLDPSIFTVLTCPTSEVGVAACDFVIFPPRYAVQEHTFRPPYYHRNCMSEFMGNIQGRYEAKPEGFLPGGASLHSCMIGHGPDADAYKKNSTMELKTARLPDTDLAFMFETTYMLRLTKWAMEQSIDADYWKCWKDLPVEFDEKNKHEKSSSDK